MAKNPHGANFINGYNTSFLGVTLRLLRASQWQGRAFHSQFFLEKKNFQKKISTSIPYASTCQLQDPSFKNKIFKELKKQNLNNF